MFNSIKFNEINGFLKKNKFSCEIVAISKNHPIESVIEAIENGVYRFGENRVLEAKEKFLNIKKTKNIELHLTGPLQSNKVKIAVNLFDIFHTLDREKIAKEFSKYKHLIKNKTFFVQVNTGMENSKSGIYVNELKDFLDFCIRDMKIPIAGLMCIPPIDEDASYHFKLLKNLAEKNHLKKLSIGMSSDYEIALKFNPSYIRLGTLLFGKR